MRAGSRATGAAHWYRGAAARRPRRLAAGGRPVATPGTAVGGRHRFPTPPSWFPPRTDGGAGQPASSSSSSTRTAFSAASRGMSGSTGASTPSW